MEKEKINIISIVWYKIFPNISGGQNGIVYFLKSISTKSNLTIICNKNNNESSTDLKINPILSNGKFQFFKRSNYKKILQLIKTTKTNYVIIENPYYFLLSFFKKKYKFQLIIHCHNIEYKRTKLIRNWYWFILFFIEKIAYKSANYIFCKTDEDALFIQKKWKISESKVLQIAYCSYIDELPTKSITSNLVIKKQLKIIKNEKIFLFAASFNYYPNQLALKHLINIIYPILIKQIKIPFKIIICGWEINNFLQKNKIELPINVINAGLVDDINDYFKLADVFINPVQIGEGVQTKNIDAIANNCNLVIYKKMQNGMPLYLNNQKIYIANENDPNDFVKQIIMALKNESNDTPEQFYEEYNWNKKTKLLIDEFLR